MLNYSWHLWDSCSNKSYANVFYFSWTRITRIYRIFYLYAKLFVASVRFVFKTKAMQMYFISWTWITRIYSILSCYTKLFVASVRFVFTPPKNHLYHSFLAETLYHNAFFVKIYKVLIFIAQHWHCFLKLCDKYSASPEKNAYFCNN